MAFPYIFHSNFEAGSNAEWDSESDSDSVISYPHYSALAMLPWSMAAPYSGAYCMQIKPAGGSADSTLTEADINISNSTTNYFRFDLYFGTDFAATVTDTIVLLELEGSGNAVTVALGCTITASSGDIVMACGSAASSATPSTDGSLVIQRNAWHTIEMTIALDTGSSGTIDIFVTKDGDVAQTTADIALTGQTHIAVTDGIFGLQDHETTTTGTILLDNFIHDDGRIYPDKRFSRNPEITKSFHAFIGPGSIDGAALLSSAGSNVMKLWDTDVADTNQDFKVELDQDRNTSFTGPLHFQKGCYVSLAGTSPRGQVVFQGNSAGGHVAPLHHSPATIRRLGQV